MDQDEKIAFKRWLKTATNQELQKMSVQLASIRARITEPDARSDFRYLRRHLLLEMDARRELAVVVIHQREK